MEFSITLGICMDFYMTFDYGKRQFGDANTVKRSGRSSWWDFFFFLVVCFGKGPKCVIVDFVFGDVKRRMLKGVEVSRCGIVLSREM